MQHYIMRFPEDQPMEVVQMSREEFLAAYPRKPTVLTSYDQQGNELAREEIPMPEDCILCDLCNDDPGETVYLYGGSRAACEPCAQQNWLPYCTPNTDPEWEEEVEEWWEDEIM